MPIPRLPFLYLRHGETEWNREGRNQGHTDVPLNGTGISQAEAAGQLLRSAGIAIGAVVASPLSRARNTAEIVVAAAGIAAPVLLDADLMECRFGVEEGRIRGGWYGDWLAGRATPEGAESFAELTARALRGLGAALARPGPVLVVAHGTLWRAARAGLGLPFDTPLPNAVPVAVVPPGGAGGGWRIEAVAA